MKILILVLIFLSSCAWNRTDKTIFATGMALKTIDCLQTIEIARNPDYYELNPIIGKHPSEEKVIAYFALGGLAYYLVADWVPEKWRTGWLSFWVGASSVCVFHNYRVGIRIGG